MADTTAYEGWALVEQMGFRKTVGMVREVEQFGTKMLRLDVPLLDTEGKPNGDWTTRFCGGPSIYQVTPLDEELALDMVRRQGDQRPPRPVSYQIESQANREAELRERDRAAGILDEPSDEGDDDCFDDEDGRDGEHG